MINNYQKWSNMIQKNQNDQEWSMMIKNDQTWSEMIEDD